MLDYQTAGITGVDAANLSEVNQQVDEQSLITVNAMQMLTDSLNTIRTYANDNTQPVPSVTDYQIAGVSGVDSDNLDDINQQVDEQTLLDVDAMRSLTDSLNTIRAYAQDNTQSAPSATDYTITGVSGVDADNVTEINQQVDEQSILVVDAMRDVMASVLTIRTYASDNTQTAPALTDFTKLGISGVDAPNLDAINEQINVQTLDSVNAIRTLVSSFNVIRAYAADNTQPAPSETVTTAMWASPASISPTSRKSISKWTSKASSPSVVFVIWWIASMSSVLTQATTAKRRHKSPITPLLV